MAAIVSLLSLLLVTGVGGSSHANPAAAVAAAPSRTMVLMEYWQAALQETPMPQAIRDLLTQPTVCASLDDRSVGEGENVQGVQKDYPQRLDIVDGPRKIGRYPRKTTVTYGSEADMHGHGNNDNEMVADVFFFHDVLHRPGTVITPTIPPTTLLPSLLPRRVADTIPFSTERYADILEMLAPASSSPAMAEEIRWTLDACEHPRPLPGEKAGCATSLEALTEIPAALLGTCAVRAFSADMPADPAGTPARRGRHNMKAVRKLSESPEILTCHDLVYPYAVFYCHTAHLVETYAVTLVAEEDEGGQAQAMEVLAVCHLDTSQWDPENPFLMAHNLKPGDVAVCHFLPKLSIIWVPAGEPGEVRDAK